MVKFGNQTISIDKHLADLKYKIRLFVVDGGCVSSFLCWFDRFREKTRVERCCRGK